MSWAEISSLPRRTQRERQVWEEMARERERIAQRRRQGEALLARQLECEQKHDHFLTAYLPDLGGHQCIACKAIVQ